MATPKILRVEGEVLTALCHKCKCCLAGGTHCWSCHVATPIAKLCGCGDCVARIDDYQERMKIRSNILHIKRMARNAA